ncbi:unnamed protein product, partial [Cyprideis torosa]
QNLPLDSTLGAKHRPSWWPKKVAFCNFPNGLTGPRSVIKNTLMDMIRKCYAFHGCELLLEIPRSHGYNLWHQDRGDGFTSFYSKTTNELVVSVNNEIKKSRWLISESEALVRVSKLMIGCDIVARRDILKLALHDDWTKLWSAGILDIGADAEIQVVMNQMSAYLRRLRNPLLDRKEFIERKQRGHENVDQFFSALQIIYDSCSYDDDLTPEQIRNKRLRDQLIVGHRDKGTQQRVFEQSTETLTLDETLRICLAQEASKGTQGAERSLLGLDALLDLEFLPLNWPEVEINTFSTKKASEGNFVPKLMKKKGNEEVKQFCFDSFSGLFPEEDEVMPLKPMRGPAMEIQLEEGAEAYKRYKANNISFHWQDKVEKQLQTLVTKDIIEPVPIGEYSSEASIRNASSTSDGLQRCRDAGITLSKKEAAIAERCVDWCGYRLSETGYTINPKLVEPITSFPPPQNKTDMSDPFVG